MLIGGNYIKHVLIIMMVNSAFETVRKACIVVVSQTFETVHKVCIVVVAQTFETTENMYHDGELDFSLWGDGLSLD